jgi:hypothetical protein
MLPSAFDKISGVPQLSMRDGVRRKQAAAHLKKWLVPTTMFLSSQ